jgi:hypothetical protein
MVYNETEIKSAFWRTFHKSGETWFNYLGTDKENNDSTEREWDDFLENLNSQKQSNIMPKDFNKTEPITDYALLLADKSVLYHAVTGSIKIIKAMPLQDIEKMRDGMTVVLNLLSDAKRSVEE